MIVYLDNSATTKIDEKALEVYNDLSNDLYSNPSSKHRFGYLAEMEVKTSSEIIANSINANPNEIIWTSGGTESNNMAIRGVAYTYKKKGMHLITTEIEHSSVKKVFEDLESEGFNVTYLKVNNIGQIDLEVLKKSLRNDTILVSIMYVNNEIGSKQDIGNIGKIIKDFNKDIIFHTDCVQGYGKYKISVKKENIDLLSVSSHKINGPKGVGFLYKNNNIRIKPLILGGGQQNGMRSGTLNVPGIVATKVASINTYNDFEKYVLHLKELRNYTINKLNELNNQYNIITINTQNNDYFSPHIVSVSFNGINSEVMLHALEEKEIYVSSGSACSSHDKKISSTLTAIGLNSNIANSTIRISFGKYNRKDDIDSLINALNELIPKLLLR